MFNINLCRCGNRPALKNKVEITNRYSAKPIKAYVECACGASSSHIPFTKHKDAEEWAIKDWNARNAAETTKGAE